MFVPFRAGFYLNRSKLPVEFYPGFLGNPDSSKSSVFILRSAPTSTVKNINWNFTKELMSFYQSSVQVARMSTNEFLCPYTKKKPERMILSGM